MSIPEEDAHEDLDLDGGKRRSRKRLRPIRPRSTRLRPRPTRSRKTKDTIIVGKIYANWCGHCQSLKPEWAKMKKIIKRKGRGKRVQFIEIEEAQMADKLPKFQQKHNVQVDANGFPSLFRLAKGKVDYYQGQRSAHPMAEWYLRGGEPEFEQGSSSIPAVLEDLYGGRRHLTRRGYKGKHFDPNYHKNANKTHNKKDSGGILSFLFGK